MCVAVAAIVLVVLAAVGCSDDAPGEKPSSSSQSAVSAERPTATELTWVGDLESWYYVVTNQAVSGCVELFDQEVGLAPSDRLRGVGDAARSACEDLVRGLADERRGLAAGDGDAIGEANELIRSSQAELERATRRARTVVPDTEKPLPRIASPSLESRVDPDLTRIAISLVREPTEIRCWSAEDWRRLSAWAEGLAFGGEGSAHFASADCTRLVRLAGVKVYGAQEAELLELFAHELEHAAGTLDEDVTECNAMQNMVSVGAALGLSRRTARELQLLFWRELYELNAADYRSEECRDGGALDLHSMSSRWP